MKKTLLLGAFALLFIQCGNTDKDDTFLISEGRIGNLTTGTQIKQVNTIYANDSIVTSQSSPNSTEIQGEVEVYEKGGKKLLVLSPENEVDPNATISDILIHDARFRTAEGLSKESLYGDFIEKHEVESIYTLLNGVMVSFKDTDLYLTIDAKYINEDARGQKDLTQDDIKADAPIKYLRISWDSK